MEIDDAFFSIGLDWSVWGSLGRTWTAVGLVCRHWRCPPLKNKKEEGPAGASPMAASMPKSVFL